MKKAPFVDHGRGGWLDGLVLQDPAAFCSGAGFEVAESEDGV